MPVRMSNGGRGDTSTTVLGRPSTPSGKGGEGGDDGLHAAADEHPLTPRAIGGVTDLVDDEARLVQ